MLVLELAASFLLSVQDHQLLCKLLVLHSEFLPDLDEASEAVDIVRVLLVNILIDL